MNTQYNYMKPSPQKETEVKGTRPATLGADDGGCSTHTTCGDCECVGNHAATDTPAGPGAQDWEHWEWTGGDMRLVLTMQQRQWNDNHMGYHQDVDYERGSEMVAAAYTPDDTTAGCWALVGLWVVRKPTPDSVQQFISRWLDDGIQLASSAIRSRYDYPVFFDRVLLSWDDTVKAISHAIQGEGWRVDWEWDFNRGADGRVVLTNTKDAGAPALVFVDPARCQQTGAGASVKSGANPTGGGAWGASATGPAAPGAAVGNSLGEATAADDPHATVPVGKDTGVDAGLSVGSGGTHGDHKTANTAAARRAGVGSDTVGSAENTESNGGVPTVGSRATIDNGTNLADSVSLCGETSSTGGGIATSIFNSGHTRDKEIPCHTEPQADNATGNAARCSSCGAVEISAGAPGTGILGEDAHTPSRRGDTGDAGLVHASTASAHSDGVADSRGEKVGMSTSRQNQKENPFTDGDDVGAELGFTSARPRESHGGSFLDAHAGATANDSRHDECSCVLGAVGHASTGTVWKHSPTPPAPTYAAPDVRGGDRGCGAIREDAVETGAASAASAPERTGIGDTTTGNTVGVSYDVPDIGFSPIVYVDYNHQEQDWFEVYGPDFTDDEGELLPDVAADARHSIPAGGGVVPVSPGSFLQVMDVVKWWLGVDATMSTDALGALRHAMKVNPR